MASSAVHLAVLGSPIAHSLSPALHRAAYDSLGLDWSYEAVRLESGNLERFLNSRDSHWRGLSLTMPLKREVLSYLDSRDEVTELVGAANTVLLSDGQRHGFNTDVRGVTAALAEIGLASVRRVLMMGAGATASSVLAALAAIGVEQLSVITRSPSKAGPLIDLAATLSVALNVEAPSASALDGNFDVVVSTVPGDTAVVQGFSQQLRESTPLLDIAYDPWPTALASHWTAAQGTAYSGLAMLVHQALAQVRIFTHGDPTRALENEDAVLAAMRAAVGAT